MKETQIGTQQQRGEAAQAGAARNAGVTPHESAFGGTMQARVGNLDPRANTANDPTRCRGTNRFGLPCRARAVRDGKCAMHSGLTNPRVMGRKGGASTETALRKQVRVDDELRDKARGVLARALDGDDERRAFEAAKSLFSYRADAPPSQEKPRNAAAQPKPISLRDLLIAAAESRVLSQMGLDESAERAFLEKLRTQTATGVD